jgi:ribonuclease P protein component
MRLPRERRLRRPGDFSRLRSSGVRLECGSFFLNAGPSVSGSGPSRLGIVAAKAQLPRAVDRNRAKRLLREAFRACPGLFPEGWDIVLVVRKSLIRQPLPRLVAALRDGAAKARAALGHG